MQTLAAERLEAHKECIPLTDEERDAVEDGIAAMEAMKTLCEKLADVAAPDGRTPRQLAGGQVMLPVLPAPTRTE